MALCVGGMFSNACLGAQSAVHVRSSWEGYVLEGLVVAGIVLYLGNYLIGRSKNGALAYTW